MPIFVRQTIILLFTVCLLCTGTARAALPVHQNTPALPIAAETGSPVTPRLSWVSSQARPGFYLARDYRNLDAESHGIVGGHQTFYWDQLEPFEGVYDWTPIEAFLSGQLAAGKRPAFGIVTFNGRMNEGNPDDPPIRVPAYVLANSDATIQCPDGFRIPKYWHDDYLTAYDRFVAALGAQYDGDPRVEFIQIGIGKFGETQPCDDQDDEYVHSALIQDDPIYDGIEANSDYTWAYVVNDLIDIYASHFQQTRLFLPNAPTFGLDKCGYRVWTEHALDLGIGLFPANLLAIQQDVDYRQWPGREGCGKFDQILDHVEQFDQGVGEESWVPLAQEGYHYMTSSPTTFYWATLAALGRHVDYITVEGNLLYDRDTGKPWYDFAEYVSIMRWANGYMGKPQSETPSVWVALRETGYQDHWRPQKGNYSWWLYQRDDVTGGQTIATTYRSKREMVDAAYYADTSVVREEIEVASPVLTLGPTKEGWICRRTDQASDNVRMGFDVHDGYAYEWGGSAEIKVAYFDYGTDTWTLVYDSITQDDQVAGIVAKTDSNTWKQVSFVLDDAWFGNRLHGAVDFAIECQGDGDEYIHMVDVRVNGHPITPTPTATPYVELGAIHGEIFEDVNGNGVRELGEQGLRDVTVQLWLGAVLVEERQSDLLGEYRFDELASANYRVKFVVPEGHQPTAGSDRAVVLSPGSELYVGFGIRQSPWLLLSLPLIVGR